MKNKLAHIGSMITIIIITWYYFVFMKFQITTGFVNAIVAFSATFLIGYSFIIGPLARFIPLCKKQLNDRKVYGLWGYALVIIHTILVSIIIISRKEPIAYSDATSIVFAGIAFMIFTLMALTSNNNWQNKLGYENWKNLQRTGYIAFAFVLIHIILLEQGVFLTRLTGQIAITFIALTLLLRAIALIFRIPSKEKIKV